MIEMNDNEIDRIAAATNALRPDWPTASIRTLLATKLHNRSRRDAAVALAWVACESDSKTPARVLEAGPWWRATNPDGADATPRPPRRDEECPIHPGNWSDSCNACRADKLAGDQTRRPTERSAVTLEHLRSVRDVVAAAKAGLCACGVPKTNCNDHRDDHEGAPEPDDRKASA